MSKDIIGPALPPDYKKEINEDCSEEESDGVAGPALPPGYKVQNSSGSSEDTDEDERNFKRGKPAGPALPPGYSNHAMWDSDEEEGSKKKRRIHNIVKKIDTEQDDKDESDFFGPALPPGYQKTQESPERPIIGPALPPEFKKVTEEDDFEDYIGPALPPGYNKSESSSDNDEIVGPVPSKGETEDNIALEIDRRAQRMKRKLITGDDEPKELVRETWMTELPPELQHFGLGSRSFKKRAGPESKDRSIWTDTPADKERKARELLEGKVPSRASKDDCSAPSERDRKLAEEVEIYNKSKRSETLIDMHAKKMKKKSEAEAGTPQERRPFDRDQDLQVNRFDEAQKKAIIKKSQELNTRFSHSKNSMFL
ncbi:GPALPP motifs-containing protein 1 [Polypterus senegalus]|uniref:GPALPP motifs-containing protein 1 n=1 Tax=Polypterus senegalus TaxID=55291 RepID=UPI001964AE2B|nr:GPALPP motifs-containing protein 1 [Polypterus senegalus]